MTIDIIPTVTLRSSDNQDFQVETAAAKYSKVVKESLEQGGALVEDGQQVIPVQVEGERLALVVQWLEHHHQKTQLLGPQNLDGLPQLTPWEEQFFGVLTTESKMIFSLAVLQMQIWPCMKIMMVLIGTSFQEVIGETSQNVTVEQMPNLPIVTALADSFQDSLVEILQAPWPAQDQQDIAELD